MLSHNRQTKEIILTKHFCLIEHYFITWSQTISKEGRIYGTGSFNLKEQQIGRGNWGKTLQKRIKARHEKGKDLKNV